MFWLCIAIAVTSSVMALNDFRWLLGVWMFAAALWYWGSIHWVDRYGSWTDTRVGE